MSKKLSAKNLHYDSSLPPFLARLRGEAGPSNPDGPDPILAGRRRPVKPRSGSADAEDVPVVVDERGNVVDGVQVGLDGSVREAEGDVLSRPGGDGSGGKGEGEEQGGKREDGKDAEGVAGVVGTGGKKKRKVGRVVGAEQGEGERDEGGDDGQGAARKKEESKAKGTKKKAKKVKLSFGDDEG